MRRYPPPWLPALLAPVAISSPAAYAVNYLTVEQAQQVLFPDAAEFVKVDIVLDSEQKRLIEREAGVRVRNLSPSVWRVSGAQGALGWFIVDEVLGKHEFITYAVAIDASGAVSGIEVMEYRESYGDEIRNEKWRAQFTGKREGESLKLEDDIVNIAGATLSCKHITEGVRRVLVTHKVAFN